MADVAGLDDLDPAGHDAPRGTGASSSSSHGHHGGGGARPSGNPHRRSSGASSRTNAPESSPLDAALQRKRREQAYLVAAMQVRGEGGDRMGRPEVSALDIWDPRF